MVRLGGKKTSESVCEAHNNTAGLDPDDGQGDLQTKLCAWAQTRMCVGVIKTEERRMRRKE
eukprot:scaffold64757_cov22-Prasinocladus_malaysianus.AAC.1